MFGQKRAKLCSDTSGEGRCYEHNFVSLVLDGFDDLGVAMADVGAHEATVKVYPLVSRTTW